MSSAPALEIATTSSSIFAILLTRDRGSRLLLFVGFDTFAFTVTACSAILSACRHIHLRDQFSNREPWKPGSSGRVQTTNGTGVDGR